MNVPTARFCGDCGTRLDGSSGGTVAVDPKATGALKEAERASGPVAERRMVTILFADLVGFTALSEGRDSEAVRELLTRYFDVARDVIERYGGTVE